MGRIKILAGTSEHFDDLQSLIEQAERAQELGARNQTLSKESRGNFQATLDYRRENMRLREALEFYGDNKNYEINVVDQWGPEIKVMMDGGAKAAELLEGLK